ncbi:glycoside hydrolase family 65 protein [Actinomadura sp. HBU206391]|uniref:glycoside hydrolase family 65 protein n=1 Tax=Actinomadura sp. HBU206391 TaxID=2731692 RepID=UPI00164F7112|nr:glycoside hydrolase family 65 protein [Actinomadura sp. HBU206391]MBC6460942.1 glycoside hydrolase family 65 protein [Actinomadura sp. HBU206391]
MTDLPVYEVDPWCVREPELRLDRLAQSESVFALSNGHVGLRGNLDEGEPHGLPGSYLNSFYELRPLSHAEAGNSYPESSQTIINVTNGKLIRLLVDDEPFDVRYGRLVDHERVLDMRAGTLTRRVEWTSPAGRTVRITSVRMVSLTQRAVAAICYEVEPVDGPVRVVIQSELVANEALPDLGRDPRAAAVLEAPLVSEEHVANGTKVVLVHRTRHSGLRMAAGMTHQIEGPEHMAVESESSPDVGRLTVATRLEPGQRLRIVKFLAYGWSSRRSRPALHDQVVAALAAARHAGWDGLLKEQRDHLDEFWSGADVELEGDAEVQQAVRFALFHIMQAGARAERRMIAAKGLTGPGYDGHTFWDTETFVLPVLTYTRPDAAADALTWRHMTLPLARERAGQLGLAGAAFPWRTIRGQECSGYWPAGTAGFHINADIADAVVRYLDATEDERFEREFGLQLLVETARLWRDLGHHDVDGVFRIDGVTGPDEYSAVADNNVYTNLMARQNLRAAAAMAMRHPDLAEELGVTTEEAASWRNAGAAMHLPYDERLGVHPQSEGFTDHARWDFAATESEQYPLLLNFPYFDLYRKQVVKQSDLVLAMHLQGAAFTEEQKARNFGYYEALTVRDSSLSAQTQAVIAAEVGHLDLAHDYLGETALMDLRDLARNTRDGLHIASLAGAWTGLVAGFGGMRAHDGRLRFAPRLPGGITRLAFRMRYRGRRLRVTVTAGSATYELLGGDELTLTHHGEEFVLDGEPAEWPIPAAPGLPRPIQPQGREPAPRRAGHAAHELRPSAEGGR